MPLPNVRDWYGRVSGLVFDYLHFLCKIRIFCELGCVRNWFLWFIYLNLPEFVVLKKKTPYGWTDRQTDGQTLSDKKTKNIKLWTNFQLPIIWNLKWTIQCTSVISIFIIILSSSLLSPLFTLPSSSSLSSFPLLPMIGDLLMTSARQSERDLLRSNINLVWPRHEKLTFRAISHSNINQF